MEQPQGQRNILINASDIISKCKTKEDRINICRELGKYYL